MNTQNTAKRQIIETLEGERFLLDKRQKVFQEPLNASVITDRVINIIAIKKPSVLHGSFISAEDVEARSKSCETEDYLLPNFAELQSKLANLKKNCTETNKSLLVPYEERLKKSFYKLVQMQMKLNKKVKGNRYDADFKSISLFLYCTSPEMYNSLENLLNLPSLSTLQHFKSDMHIKTSISEESFKPLKKFKIDCLTEEERDCCVCISTYRVNANLFYDLKHDKIVGFHDIDHIQRPILASRALVVAVRGMFGDWQQFVTLAFLEEHPNFDTISLWIDKVIGILLQLGLKVRALVSDLTSDFMIAYRLRAGNTNYFYVNQSKIYFISDPSLLLVSLRDNLTKYDFYFDGMIAKWDHIMKYYEYDKSKALRLTSEITDKHVKPISIQKRYKGKYTAELLSANVAAAMSTYVDFNVIDGSAVGTVALLSKISKWYTILTSNKSKEMTAEVQDPISFLNDFLLFLNSLQVVDPLYGNDVTAEANFVEALKITVGSILILNENPKSPVAPCFSNLTLDCFEELLQDVLNTGNATTCKTILSSFLKIYISGIFKTSKNETEHIDKLLTEPEGLETLKTLIEKDEIESFWTGLKPNSMEISNLKLPEDNKLLYFSGYLLKRTFQLHPFCEKFKKYISQNSARTNKIDGFVYKDFNEDTLENKLIYPPDDFVDSIKSMENLFKSYFYQDRIPNIQIARGLYNTFELLSFPKMCTCFPFAELKKLYIFLRLQYTLSRNNEEFKDKQVDSKGFILNLDIF